MLAGLRSWSLLDQRRSMNSPQRWWALYGDLDIWFVGPKFHSSVGIVWILTKYALGLKERGEICDLHWVLREGNKNYEQIRPRQPTDIKSRCLQPPLTTITLCLILYILFASPNCIIKTCPSKGVPFKDCLDSCPSMKDKNMKVIYSES